MRLIFILLSMLMIAGMMACNKEVKTDYTGIVGNGNTESGYNGNYGIRLKTDGEFTYTYDEKGRLNVIYASSGPTKYYYADSVVTEVTHFINGTITGINIYKLRPNGLVYMRQNGFQTTNTYSTFEYSASRGLLLQVDTFMLGVSSMRHIYYRTGNRIDSIKRIYQNVRNTHIFEYHTDRINTVTNESAGKSFLGISNANPIKRESVRNAYGTLTIVGDYTYEYDAQNRITKRIMTRTGFPTEEITYSYY